MSENQTFIADNDLDSYQYHIMVNSGGLQVDRVATANVLSVGVLQNKPKADENATVCVAGVCRIRAGGTIVGGNEFTVTASATATAAGSGAYILGLALTSVASGGNFQGIITHSGYKG